MANSCRLPGAGVSDLGATDVVVAPGAGAAVPGAAETGAEVPGAAETGAEVLDAAGAAAAVAGPAEATGAPFAGAQPTVSQPTHIEQTICVLLMLSSSP